MFAYIIVNFAVRKTKLNNKSQEKKEILFSMYMRILRVIHIRSGMTLDELSCKKENGTVSG
jgi:hypothetical protein